MNGDTAHRIRALLLQHPEGLTVDTISRALQREYTNIAKRLHNTYGCYVLKWTDRRQVWCCVPVPANAVRPAREAPPPKPVKPPKLVPPPYKPEKTFWQPVAPWPGGQP